MRMISSISDLGDDQANELEQAKRVQAGRIEAIRFLGLARKPSGRVAKRLQDAGFEHDEIAAVLQSLIEDGYLDDAALARRQAARRRGRQGESRRALTYRLSQSGLTDTAIETALEDYPDDFTLAQEVLSTRFQNIFSQWPLYDAQERQRQKGRMARFLASRGFGGESVLAALRDHLAGIDSDDSDQA